MISLIITTYNEEQVIGSLLEDILNQTIKPSELVIVDGGSTDSTIEKIKKHGDFLNASGIVLVLRREEGANIAQGRNIAIKIAKNENILVTDAGCRLDQSWVEEISLPLLEGRADLVGGFFRPLAHNPFQEVLAKLTTTERPGKGFLPSSRSVAFKKSLWAKVGGYPEWLPWGEDTLFDALCLKEGARYTIAERAIVHWEVRKDYKAMLKQFYRYGFGDGLARRFSLSHIALQSIYWGALVGGTTVHYSLFVLPLIYAASWLVRKKVVKAAYLPMAFMIALGIQVSRFSGFVIGFFESFTSKSKA